MPAAEAIYRPYDFRYIYDQCMQEVKKDETADARNRESEPQKEGTLEFSDAGLWDAEEMADFFEEIFRIRGKYMLSEIQPIIRR